MGEVHGNKNIKRLVAKTLSVNAVGFGVVFLLMPIGAFYQVIICIGSLLFALISGFIAESLNDEHTGYWPTKPKI